MVDQNTQLQRHFNLQSQKDGVCYRDHPRPDSGRLHHLHHRHHVVLLRGGAKEAKGGLEEDCRQDDFLGDF